MSLRVWLLSQVVNNWSETTASRRECISRMNHHSFLQTHFSLQNFLQNWLMLMTDNMICFKLHIISRLLWLIFPAVTQHPWNKDRQQHGQWAWIQELLEILDSVSDLKNDIIMTTWQRMLPTEGWTKLFILILIRFIRETPFEGILISFGSSKACNTNLQHHHYVERETLQSWKDMIIRKSLSSFWAFKTECIFLVSIFLSSLPHFTF